MGGNWKSRWEAFWRWLHRIEIIDSLAEISLPKMAIALVVGGVMGIWSYLDKLPGYAVAFFVLAGFVGLIWGWNGLLWMKGQRRQVSAGREQQMDSTPAKSGKSLGDEEALLGDWFITSTKHDYIGVWSFSADRKVKNTWYKCDAQDKDRFCSHSAEGRWALAEAEIQITWDTPAHRDTLRLPITPARTVGDSWANGIDTLEARKFYGS